MNNDKIVAVGLLTQCDVDMLSDTFSRIWPVEDAPCFSGLVRAIEVADRDLEHSRLQNAGIPPAG